MNPMDIDELKRRAARVEEIRGWNFSRMKTRAEPVPWDYREIVRRYLRPTDRVLDIATGGGEVFLSLVPFMGSGLGTDFSPQMIATARENTPPELAEKVSWAVMEAQNLEVEPQSFDLVLNRHGPVFLGPILRALRPGGYFICQQVGGLNSRNIIRLFGWDSGGDYWRDYWDRHGFPHQDVASLTQQLTEAGCRIVAQGSYNTRTYFVDVEPLIFFLKAVPLPEDFDINRHAERVLRFIDENNTPEGIETNEHREILIAQKG
jgi:ubiquinone/menaquinone biosynthesis C-methylase UbiE